MYFSRKQVHSFGKSFPGSMTPPKLVRGAGGSRDLKSPQGSEKPPASAKK